MPDQHALLSASKMTLWESCRGAPALWERIPVKEERSVYAEEGTLAHTVGEQVLRGDIDSSLDYDFSQHHDIRIGVDFHTAVMHYVEYVDARVRTLTKRDGRRSAIQIEQRLSLANLGFEDMFGTGDCVLSTPSTLAVIDYKHGAGVAVAIQSDDFRPNRQLMYYLLGAIAGELSESMASRALEFTTADKLNTKAGQEWLKDFKQWIAERYEHLELHVVQPRVWVKDQQLNVTAQDVILFYQDLVSAVGLAQQQRKCETGNLKLEVGDHCRWCKVRNQCPARVQAAINEAMEEFKQMDDLVQSSESSINCLDSASLSEILLKAEKVERLITVLRGNAEARLRTGEEIPGFALVPKRPQRKWYNEMDVLDLLRERLGEQADHCLSVRTPAQVLKLAPKSLTKELESLVVKESSGLKLGKSNEEETNSA